MVSGKAIFAKAITTNKIVSMGALCATPPSCDILRTPVCLSINSITIHKPIIFIPWQNICSITPCKPTSVFVKIPAHIKPMCAIDE